jgi:hypothetical protein
MKQDRSGLKRIKYRKKITAYTTATMMDPQLSSMKTCKVGKASLKKIGKNAEGSDAFEELMLNPMQRQGKRNVYCPYYSLCLDHAVQKGWQYWDCDECLKKDVRKPLEGAGEAPTQAFEYHGLGHMRTEEF